MVSEGWGIKVGGIWYRGEGTKVNEAKSEWQGVEGERFINFKWVLYDKMGCDFCGSMGCKRL